MKVGIIGCGASGALAAITAAKNGHKVTVFDHSESPMKKILSTGNGKCNFTNEIVDASFYNHEAKELFDTVYSRFTNLDTLKFFNSIGVVPYVKKGYYYPRSEQASSILNCLLYEHNRLKVDIICGTDIEKIEKNEKKEKNKKNDRFILTTAKGKYEFDRLIMAAGSNAVPKTGSDGSGYGLCIKLGHKVIKPLPALCGLKSDSIDFRDISGVRCQAKVSLFIDDKLIKEDAGELQITDYGISGIPVFQLSALALRAKDEGRKVSVLVDYASDFEADKLINLLQERAGVFSEKYIEDYLEGMFNKKMALYFIKETMLNVNPEVNKFPPHSIMTKEIADDYFIGTLVKIIKGSSYNIKGHRGFDNCQICSGGIDLSEVKNTLESRIIDGLYFCGEILDVNGDCGGYNLQWAWSSGYVAGLME